jgi:hypothetical protein
MFKERHCETRKAGLPLADRFCPSIKEASGGAQIQIVMTGYDSGARFETCSQRSQIINAMDVNHIRLYLIQNAPYPLVSQLFGALSEVAELRYLERVGQKRRIAPGKGIILFEPMCLEGWN